MRILVAFLFIIIIMIALCLITIKIAYWMEKIDKKLIKSYMALKQMIIKAIDK